MMSAGMLVLFLPFMLIQFVPVELLGYLEEVATHVAPMQIALYLAGALVVIEALLLSIAMRLFQRSRLILD